MGVSSIPMWKCRVNFNTSAIITQKIWRRVNKPVEFEVIRVQQLLCYAPSKRDRGLSRAETGPAGRGPGIGCRLLGQS